VAERFAQVGQQVVAQQGAAVRNAGGGAQRGSSAVGKNQRQ
jgi:hypothetical protein